ncbi:MAG: signal peptidase II [Gemmatimonadales bacterium]|nr:signal peptidase II [Gemmatimonadales bacterium]
MRSAAEGGRFWILLIVVVALDRVTKVMAEAALAGDRIINVVGDVFRLRLVYNPGAAFGIHVGPYSRWFFLVVAIVAVWLLRRMWIEASPTDTLRRWAVAIVAGGAAGNMIDRVLSSRGVIDFIDVGLQPASLRWPTFNVADIAVTCGAVALAISLWREDAERRRAVQADTG